METDKTIICKDCGKEFVFTAGEQQFYAEKGLTSEPVRCKECRAKRRDRFNDDSRRHTVMYEAVCARCGEVASVPFEPRHDRPVYCDACYKAMRAK